MQEHRFQVRLADVDRADLDAALVGLGHHCRQHILRFMGDHRDRIFAGAGFENILHTVQGFCQRFRIVVLADVQDERLGLADLLGELLLCPKRDQLTVVDDSDPVRELLGFLHIVGCVQDRHALPIEVLDGVENGTAGLRVDADRGLVHEQQARLVEQAHADVDPALHAS